MFKISSLRHPVLVLALGLLLSSAASAAKSPWSGLLKLLPGIVWGDVGEKRGCGMDPDGLPCANEAQRQPRHRPSRVSPKGGCSISPDGHTGCELGSPKHGCGISPDGVIVCEP